MQFGFNVRIKWFLSNDPQKKVIEETYHNITEIHYNLEPVKLVGVQISFKSEVHAITLTRSINQIVEYEATLATQLHKDI